MTATQYLLAIDQGTTGSTSLVMDTQGQTLGRATREFQQHFPEPGHVEHDAEQIWESVVAATQEALKNAQIPGDRIAAVGITNQRETTLLWDRETGAPIHRAIVWQDRRTAPFCAELKAQGHEPSVRERTGLVLDPYFSGTKVRWLLDNVSGAREQANQGKLAFGTIDSFLVWRLSGDQRVHVSDVSNASRTLLMNLNTLEWDDNMLALLNVPRSVLPKIVGSAERIAHTKNFPGIPDGTPISGIAGDQQAALFGQACFGIGEAKCTYGTGAFVLVNIGEKPISSRFGLLGTVAWKINGKIVYALEGSAFIAGAAVQWLRDGLKIIEKASDIESLAASVPSSDGVSFVPALSGLGAPYWDPDARGIICGLSRGSTQAHIARATLEGIAHSVADLLGAMSDDLGKPLSRMRVDGGAAANNLLMQFQSDVAGVSIERPHELESTARGAAMLAGVGAGIFKDEGEAAGMAKAERVFGPAMTDLERGKSRGQWLDAVARSRGKISGGC